MDSRKEKIAHRITDNVAPKRWRRCETDVEKAIWYSVLDDVFVGLAALEDLNEKGEIEFSYNKTEVEAEDLCGIQK